MRAGATMDAPTATPINGTPPAAAASPLADPLPHALDAFTQSVAPLVSGKRLVVFLDYDGTLTPIVSRPDAAVMSAPMRQTLRELAEHCIVAIVTGRSMSKIVDFVNLDELYYAGSHGFDIRGPSGSSVRHQVADDMRPAMEETMDALARRVAHVAGAELEDNYMSVSVHYRAVAEDQVADVEDSVDSYVSEASHPLVKHHGKKVFELRPKVDWNKGHAVVWLAKYMATTLGCAPDDLVPVYIGDDVSDEDAFTALAKMPQCITVKVSATPAPTRAHFRIRDPSEVRQFLRRLTELAEDTPAATRAPNGGGAQAAPADGTAEVATLADAALPLATGLAQSSATSDGGRSANTATSGAGAGAGAGCRSCDQ